MAPSVDRFLSISCTNVGVGPGGTTNLLAYSTPPPVISSSNVHTNLIIVPQTLSHCGLSRCNRLRQIRVAHYYGLHSLNMLDSMPVIDIRIYFFV